MRSIIALFLFLNLCPVFGQSSTDTTTTGDNVLSDLLSGFVIKMNESEYFLDSIPGSIQPKWIKKIEVLKWEEQKGLFGNGDGIILVYPRRKYFKEIRLILDSYQEDKAQVDQ
ncbi:MAG: hypothetical protein AAFN93_27140 [Bacteroidota bacterium]